jgi:secreted trypsin-like serine protease
MARERFLAAGVLLCSCCSAHAIIQGQPARRAYSDTYAAITIATLRTCGGVAIDSRRVLTGAHCLSIGGVDFADMTNSLGLLSVAKGNVTLDSSDEEASVAEIVIHPEYRFEVDTGAIFNDVAVLVLGDELAGPFATISESVPSAGVAIGLGMNDAFDLMQPDRLYQVELPVVGEDGGSIVAGLGDVPPPIPSVCWGDSGGGFYELGGGRVFGLVSWEPDKCVSMKTDYQVFTNLVYFRDWIDQQQSE